MSHRLTELIDLIQSHGVRLPEVFEELRHLECVPKTVFRPLCHFATWPPREAFRDALLTPFAVEFRYDVFPDEPEDPLDKPQIRQRLKDLRAWVEAFLQQRASP